ncbi:hypothetical protein GCM10020000_10340 [Streptomyces olivoverticillatus]
MAISASPRLLAGGVGREAKSSTWARRAGERSASSWNVCTGERQNGAACQGAYGEVPGAVRLQGHALAEVVAVGQGAERGLVPVFAGARLGELAVGDQEDLVGGLVSLHQGVSRRVLPLDESVRQRLQGVAVTEPAQQRQLSELRGMTRTSVPVEVNSTRPSPTV